MTEAQLLATLQAATNQRIDVTFVARGRIRLLRPVSVILGGRRIIAPKGFECDGASIPPFFWPIVGHPFSGSSLRAAIIHDALSANRTMPCRMVHRLFAQLLAVDGVAPMRRWLMSKAVAWFGPRWTLPDM